MDGRELASVGVSAGVLTECLLQMQYFARRPPADIGAPAAEIVAPAAEIKAPAAEYVVATDRIH